MDIIKATVSIVKLGTLEFEGLLFEDGRFAIAIPQLAELNLVPPNRSQKQLESLLGIAFQSHEKAKTPLNPKPVNCIGLLDLERVLRALDRKGNIHAQSICDNLIGLALSQLFADAFNIKFEKDDRQQYLVKRQTHREQFHPQFTAWLKKDAEGNCSAINWGLEVNKLKLAAGIPLTHIDEYNPDDYITIDKLNRAYSSYNSLRLAGISHEAAIGILKLQSA